MKSKFRKLLGTALMAAAVLSPQLRADDIDLYVGGEAATGAQSNVLIVLDNSSNWANANQNWPDGGKQGVSELQTLSEVISTLGDNINLGLMTFAANGADWEGQVRYHIREMNGANKSRFKQIVDYMAANAVDGNDADEVSSSTDYDVLMNAAFRYFNGKARYPNINNAGEDRKDHKDNAAPTAYDPVPNPSGYKWAYDTATQATYNAPTDAASGCAKNFIIFIGNGFPSSVANDAETQLTNAASLIGVTPDTSQITPISPKNPYADEWARFMYAYGVKSTVDDPKSTASPKEKLWNKIATYTIDVCKDHCEDPQATLLKSMAKVGGGKYFKSTSKAEIKNALALIFAEIQAVNSVFASATLPISVNTQGTYENQVYIGVFRPDAAAKPRWFGNLKEYKFGRYCDADNNDKVLIDTTRSLVNGMIDATLSGNAYGTIAGTFTGTVTSPAGVSTPVSGTVTGSATGTSKATLAATFGGSAGTTVSPGASAGNGTVTGTVSGTGSGTGTSTFTGTLNGTPSVSGLATATDERVGEDVPAPNCGLDASNKTIPVKLYMGDKHGYRAIDEEGNTGFIDLSAKSYWTSALTNGTAFWTASPNATAGAYDSPDGPDVERGAAAQRLRTHWAETATAPHPDGRKVYTCLGNCLTAGATASQRTLANNPFTTSSSDVINGLVIPSGTFAPDSFYRTGSIPLLNKIRIYKSAGHGLGSSGTVNISVTGATDPVYNVSNYPATIVDSQTIDFTLSLNEQPQPVAAIPATVSAVGTPVTLTSITLDITNAGQLATATISPGGGFTPGNTITIAGASQAFLNSSFTVGPTPDKFQVTIPAAPVSPATTPGTSVAVGQSATNSSVLYDGVTGRITVIATANLGNQFRVGATVVISGATPTAYNGTYTIVDTGTSCPSGVRNTSYCVARSFNATAVDTGSGSMTATPTSGAPLPVRLWRYGGYNFMWIWDQADWTDGTGLYVSPLQGMSTVQVAGSSVAAYNGVWNITYHYGGTQEGLVRVSPVAFTPANPAGPITVTVGASGGPSKNNLINWTRGKDLWEDEDLNASLTNVRASIHGDVLHARPVVVNYGGSTGIIGFYGSNDGFLRAVHGGTGEADGEEKWAFMPQEFVNYSKLSRLYSNAHTIRYPYTNNASCSATPTPRARDYFWDGSLAAYQGPDGAGVAGKTWLFATMRRGGRSLYAIDVTDPDTPIFMWRITNATTGFSELGQTWSEPKITKLKGNFTRADATVITNPVVLVFGAGYDASQEDQPAGSLITPTMGRGVFVVEAETGQLIQFLQPTTGVKGYSFVADVNVLDLDGDGFVDRIYAGDTNANIFRFDTVPATPAANVASSSFWQRYHIAKVGDVENSGNGDGGTNARKFMFSPEVLPFTHNGVLKTMVLVGSGNREKPLPNFSTGGSKKELGSNCQSWYADTYFPDGDSGDKQIDDRFFGLLDAVETGAVEATANADPIEIGDLQQVNSTTLSTTTLTPLDLSSSKRGWTILLRNDPDGSGSRNEEKAVNAARVVGGVVYFATNTPVSPNPSAGVCTNLGEALGYAIDPFTGLPAINRDDSVGAGGEATYTTADYATKFAGGGLPPTVTAGVVSIGGTPYRFIIGSGGSALTSASSIAGQRSVLNLTGRRSRLYWSYDAD